MVLYLIRHGKTAANENHLYCGSTDLSLSETGKEELRKLRYEIPENVRFLTSGMKRTEQTLELLFGNLPHEARTEFRELDFGDFEMKSYEALKTEPAYQEWISGDNERNVPPHGESGVQMQKRALAALERLQAENRDTVLISHGGTVALIMARLFPSERRSRYEWQPSPGHGYRIEGDSYTKIP